MRLTHTSIPLLIVMFSLLVTAGGKPLRIHMLSGSGEYKSAVSLPKWAKLLEKDGHTCTIAAVAGREAVLCHYRCLLYTSPSPRD